MADRTMGVTNNADVGVTLCGQDIYEASTVQRQKLGEKLVLGDRTFRYGKAGAALTGLFRGVGNFNHTPGATDHEDHDGYEGTTLLAAPAGTKTVRISDTTARVANYYAEGYAAIYTTVFQFKKIKSSKPGTGVYVDIELYDELDYVTVAATTAITCYISQWSNLQPGNDGGYASIMGMPLIAVASGSYFWCQTGGPCIVTPTEYWGTAEGRMALWHTDGTIKTAASVTSGAQIAGYLIERLVSGYGDLLVYLQGE